MSSLNLDYAALEPPQVLHNEAKTPPEAPVKPAFIRRLTFKSTPKLPKLLGIHHIFDLDEVTTMPKDGQGLETMKIFLKTVLALFALIISSNAMSSSSEAVFERKMAQAQKGNAEAQYDVGYRYEKGRGTDEDEDEAFVWYGKSADQGLDKAQYKVGIAYLKGSGVDRDREVAKVWLQKAADQGYPPAQYQLGKLLASKFNKDYGNALVWLQKAQDNGYEPATGEIRKVKRKLN